MKTLLEISTASLLPWRSLAALLCTVAGAAAASLVVKSQIHVSTVPLLMATAAAFALTYAALVWRFDLLQEDEKLALTGWVRKTILTIGRAFGFRKRDGVTKMCGIAGIVSLEGKPVFEREVRDMCAAITHRGPDDEGYYFGTGVGLGMRRLSIIDLASGRQPIRNEDGSVWVVFNGEIYNFRELRRDLEGRGHVFSTNTDTETIVHLYEEYGKRAVDHMRGMFTFALWDQRTRQLLLARDRVGIKPLYYAEIDGRILFASELKAILQLAEVERKINWSAASHLFTFLSTPPADAIIEGVRKLEPGHLLIASPGRAPVIERYWDLKFEPDYARGENHFVERVRELLDESVRLHLISDVPLGAFLSGGIDSSSIVARAAALTPVPLQTFSIGFDEPDYNELDHARVVARMFGTDHQELTLGPDALDQMEDLAWHLDEPFGDSSAIPTYMVSRLASQKVKVVLSGDGGDELFAGYDKYLVEQRGAKPLGIARARPQPAGSHRPDHARRDAGAQFPAAYLTGGSGALPGRGHVFSGRTTCRDCFSPKYTNYSRNTNPGGPRPNTWNRAIATGFRTCKAST